MKKAVFRQNTPLACVLPEENRLLFLTCFPKNGPKTNGALPLPQLRIQLPRYFYPKAVLGPISEKHLQIRNQKPGNGCGVLERKKGGETTLSIYLESNPSRVRAT